MLGWLDTPLPVWIAFLHGGGLIVLSLAEPAPAVRLPARHRVVLLALFAVSTLAVLIQLYLRWTPVSGPVVMGLQGATSSR